MQATILQTERLTLRQFTGEDAGFILALLNEPGWLQYIGDKGVRTLDAARAYIESGPQTMYAREGFGLYRVALTASDVPIGMCGLIRRPGLDDVDIGFALLARYAGQGYGYEAASAIMAYGRDVVGLQRLVAITSPDNQASIKLLQKIGFRFERMIVMGEAQESLRLFSHDFKAQSGSGD